MVGGADLAAPADALALPDGSGSVPLSADLARILTDTRPDVLVDFTIASAAMPAVRVAAAAGVNLVVGTSGLTADDLDEIESLVRANNIGAVVTANFALGAVLMMHLAKIVAPHLDHAEIIELHHDRKVDAPSGTAATTARIMAEARGRPFLRPDEAQPGAPAPSRGEIIDGVTVHSVRLPGLLAHQEVIFGASGQTLSIRHDTISRESFMPGVMLAVKEVVVRKDLVRGLGILLGLEES
jgi:4-hydroxy-tetrahydrodipicolinate reductase